MDVLNYVKGEFDVVTSGVGVDIDDDASDGITVINTYDTEKYKEMAEKAYELEPERLFYARFYNEYNNPSGSVPC